MPRPAPQIDRVVAVLDLLAGRTDGASLTELADALGESSSTMVHVLGALTSSGYLVREPADRRYHLGPALVEPGRVAAARYPELAIARRHMDRLSKAFGAPCYAFERAGRWARLVHYTRDPEHADPPMQVGELIPVAPPLGAVFIAWAPRADVDAWLDADPSGTPERRAQLSAVLDQARELGFLVEGLQEAGLGDRLFERLRQSPSPARDGELRTLLSDGDGGLASGIDPTATYRVAAIGAPVFGPSGAVDLSIALSTFDRALSGEEVHAIGEQVRSAAAAATRELAAGT